MRTPSTLPQTSMQAPPTTGPSAFGMRRTSECSETPMTCFCFGSALATSPIVAGSEIDDHDRNTSEPTTTACQLGTRITNR